MKLKSIQTVFFLLMLAMLNIKCGKDGDSGVFLPNLTFTWYNKADATNTNTFFFLNAPNANTGTFTGNENPIGGGAQFRFTGSFSNKDIQWTYDAGSTRSGKSYSGTINDASNLITLNSTTLGSLVLEKR